MNKVSLSISAGRLARSVHSAGPGPGVGARRRASSSASGSHTGVDCAAEAAHEPGRRQRRRDLVDQREIGRCRRSLLARPRCPERPSRSAAAASNRSPPGPCRQKDPDSAGRSPLTEQRDRPRAPRAAPAIGDRSRRARPARPAPTSPSSPGSSSVARGHQAGNGERRGKGVAVDRPAQQRARVGVRERTVAARSGPARTAPTPGRSEARRARSLTRRVSGRSAKRPAEHQVGLAGGEVGDRLLGGSPLSSDLVRSRSSLVVAGHDRRGVRRSAPSLPSRRIERERARCRWPRAEDREFGLGEQRRAGWGAARSAGFRSPGRSSRPRPRPRRARREARFLLPAAS